jgi:hypothetical protein
MNTTDSAINVFFNINIRTVVRSHQTATIKQGGGCFSGIPSVLPSNAFTKSELVKIPPLPFHPNAPNS